MIYLRNDKLKKIYYPDISKLRQFSNRNNTNITLSKNFLVSGSELFTS